jgi:hypothetical protein
VGEIMGRALDIIDKLSVVEFNWKHDESNEIGIIAEEVEKVFPEAVWYKDGKVEGLKFLPLISLLIKGIQEVREETSNE